MPSSEGTPLYLAMRAWEQAGVEFIELDDESIYLSLVIGSNATSHVGYVGGATTVALRVGATIGEALHELGHVLGLFHEHCREDRDRYVTYRPKSLKHPEDEKDFTIVKGIEWCEDARRDYDSESVMHYGPYDGWNGRDWVLESKKPGVTLRSPRERDAPSKGDLALVRSLYARSGG